MSEINAAMGLLQLQHVGRAIEKRARIAALYRELLGGVPGLFLPEPPADATANHAYFPVLVQPGFAASRDDTYQRLRARGVMARRYFHPLISDFPMYRGLPSARAEGLPHARRAADQVICLPIYPALEEEDVRRIASIIVEAGEVRASGFLAAEPVLLAA
jgi:dTDP-4-amino-4,6-dideoxygalactose transaminase